jgi:alanine racemase
MASKNHPLSYIEISKSALVHNVQCFRKIIKKGTKIAGVIKANAYGHGDTEVVKILAPHVDYFQINSVEELEGLRRVTKKPIFLFGYVAKSDLTKAMKLGCILTVFDLNHIRSMDKVAGKLKIKQKVHVAIDAHLGREGVMPKDAEKFLQEAKKLKNIKIEGVYAHFANIEDIESTGKEWNADFSHAQKQIDTYKRVIEIFKEFGYKNISTHISATSGVLAYENWQGINPIVRVGIGLYGIWPSEILKKVWIKKFELKPVMKWITHIAQVKELPANHSIGYGLTYVTKKPTKIAVIPQGYSNGLPRSASNKGSVLIRSMRAPILGRVAMNMFVVDVSNIKGVKEEDEVVILGKQGKDNISAEELGEMTGTINYEVTTRMSPLLPRIVA